MIMKCYSTKHNICAIWRENPKTLWTKNKKREKTVQFLLEASERKKRNFKKRSVSKTTLFHLRRTWEIFSDADADADADDNRYKWQQINNTSDHVINPLPPPIASPLPSMFDLLLHASTSHLFQPQGNSHSHYWIH